MLWPLLFLLCPVTGQDYDALRSEIRAMLEDPSHDDGSLGPVVLRLAWHSASTYSPEAPIGGTAGAGMRFSPEKDYEANRGLEIARTLLSPLAAKYDVSFSDLWVLAGYAAIEEMGGPSIEFVPGRLDVADGSAAPPEERIPEWEDSLEEFMMKFQRMGFSSRDVVALMGAHTVGRTHPEASGFHYFSWTNTQTKFDNDYFWFLLNMGWQLEEGTDGRLFYFNRSWIMLTTDFVLRTDPELRPIALEYSENEAQWHADFAIAFKALTELGLARFPAAGLEGPWAVTGEVQ